MALENEATKAVRITNTSTVLPANPSAKKPACPLVTFDLPYITFYYNQKLMLYKCEGDFGGIVGKLKDGLGAVLEEFYPLAGRIRRDAEGLLVVERCEGGEGVEVVEAAAEGLEVGELAEGDSAGVLGEVVPYNGVMNLEGIKRPLLAVQFTKLKDGIAIGCAFNHAILDGNSTWHFMSSWAELCRGSLAVSLPPFHDRLQARAVCTKLDLPDSADAHEKADPNGPPKPLHGKIFSFSEAAIDRIKTDANSRRSVADANKPISTFQSLGAHVWRAVCRARRLRPEDPTVFAIFIDCRKRLDPPMPESYFGNVIQAIFTATATGLLLSNPPEFGADLLQKVIDSHDSKAIKGRLEEYEAKPKLFYFSDAGVNTVAVGSSPRFKVYDVDFGFGRPEKVRSGLNNKFDGMMYLYPGRGGGRSIDVELTLDGEAMANIEKDEEFLVAGV